MKYDATDDDTPRAVMLLAGMLALRVQHANRGAVKEGTRTVHMRRPIRDPETGDAVAVVGIGHRTLFWREP